MTLLGWCISQQQPQIQVLMHAIPFPPFNYLSYKNKTTVFIFPLPSNRGHIHTEAWSFSLAHPSPEAPAVLRVKDRVLWAGDWSPGAWRSGAKGKTGAVGAGRALTRGEMVAASPICSGLLLGIASSSLAATDPVWDSSCWSCSAARACRRLRGARGARAGAVRASTGSASVPLLGYLGPGAQPGPLERGAAGTEPGPCHSAPTSRLVKAQEQNRWELSANGGGSASGSWSLGVANLEEKVGTELTRDTGCSWMKCIVRVCTFIRTDQRELPRCSLITICFQQKRDLTKLREGN